MINKQKKGIEMKIENIEIEIWDDAECRDEEISYTLSADDIGVESVNDIVSCMQIWYDDEVKNKKGSIEIHLNDDDGEWLKTMYHISEDSNDFVRNIR